VQEDEALIKIAATFGVWITFGFTLTCTASKTSRPARSIAEAWRKSSPIPALSAEMSASTTRSTLPLARNSDSSSLTSSCSPALVAAMSGITIRFGSTFRNRIPTSVKNATPWPLAMQSDKCAPPHAANRAQRSGSGAPQSRQ